jgi:hypothetical protein
VELDGDSDDIRPPRRCRRLGHTTVAIEIAKPLEPMECDTSELDRVPGGVDDVIALSGQFSVHRNRRSRRWNWEWLDG